MKFTDELYCKLFDFELCRKYYSLSSAKNGFFTPFNTLADVQQQLRTTLVAPLLAVTAPLILIPNLIKDIGITLIGLLCGDDQLAGKGMHDLLLSALNLIVFPMVAAVVALASVLSLVTRSLGTLFPRSGECLDELTTDIFLENMPKAPRS